MNKKLNHDRWYGRIMPPQILLPVSIAGIIIIIASVFLEYRSRRDDYLNMLEKRATIFIETLRNNAQYAFNAAEELENEINNNIFAELNLIERIDRNTSLSVAELNEILMLTNLAEIQVYDRNLRISHKSYSSVEAPVSIPQYVLQSVSQERNEKSIYVIPDTVNYEEDYLVAVVKRANGGVIAGIITGEKIRHFRSVFGFGQIFKSFTKQKSVEYIVLENELTIIAGFFQGYSLSSFADDIFLRDAFRNETIKSRIIEYDRGPLFEAVATYTYDNEPVGLLRMGISMVELEAITTRAKRRMFVIAGLMVVVGLVFANFVLSYRHRQLLRKELSYLNVYTNTILDHLESGVITINGSGRVKLVNKQAAKFLGLDYVDVYDKSYTLFPDIFVDAIEDCRQDSRTLKKSHYYSLPGSGETRWLSLRTTILKEDEEKDTCILLVDDMTEQVQLEEQKRTNEKLAAMRRLASGVAHEIRNPLNSIKLIIDLLRSDYIQGRDTEKYSEYFSTVHGEIERISSIVEEFLRFARPPDLKPEHIDFSDFFGDIETLYRARLNSDSITLTVNVHPHPVYTGDPAQLKQVFMNLIENAIQACGEKSSIVITGNTEGDSYEISVRDNGQGISSDNINHIFDLYFTTKEKGSGIGLAIAHQIITRHNGTIEVESEEGVGTNFILRLPFKTEFNTTTLM